MTDSAAEARPLPPGSTLGIFGGGQLGRMFALAAARLGYRVAVYTDKPDSPTAQVCDRATVGDYDDLDAVREFAKSVSACSYEFENIPCDTIEAVADVCPVAPGAKVLAVAQDRRIEKRTLSDHGFPVAEFRSLAAETSADIVAKECRSLGLPCVLKTARFGYDGKGQWVCRHESDLAEAVAALAGREAVAERLVDFAFECSLVVARSGGEMRTFGPIENRHHNHILDVSLLGAAVDGDFARRAAEIARGVAEALELQGVLCLEFFALPGGELLINELAPRPHNSGHLTIEATACSQFEQQVRILAGLPLGDASVRRPTVMVNLLGDLWSGGEPDWAAALAADPEFDAHLHLYGKAAAKIGRKMGHLTLVATRANASLERLAERGAELRDRLRRKG